MERFVDLHAALFFPFCLFLWPSASNLLWRNQDSHTTPGVGGLQSWSSLETCPAPTHLSGPPVWYGTLVIIHCPCEGPQPSSEGNGRERFVVCRGNNPTSVRTEMLPNLTLF